MGNLIRIELGKNCFIWRRPGAVMRLTQKRRFLRLNEACFFWGFQLDLLRHQNVDYKRRSTRRKLLTSEAQLSGAWILVSRVFGPKSPDSEAIGATERWEVFLFADYQMVISPKRSQQYVKWHFEALWPREVWKSVEFWNMTIVLCSVWSCTGMSRTYCGGLGMACQGSCGWYICIPT